MNRFSVLVKKEWLEAGRSYKILWLPVVFMLLGILQPLSTYYMPQILEMVGGLPAGVHLTLPEFTGNEVMASTLSDQFDQLGVMILVISMMGMIVTDKSNGMLTFILTRNTTLTEYLASKWIVQAAIVAIAVLAGFLMASFYTIYLYSAMPLASLAAGLAIYYLWCLFIVTLTLTLGALLSRVSAVAVAAILALLVLKVLTALGAGFQSLNPAYLPNHAINLISTGEVLPYFFITVAVTVLMIALLLFFSKLYLSRKELPSM